MNEQAAHALMRVQIAMWLPASCAECGREYESVDDFLARNPRAGQGWDSKNDEWTDRFVDDSCYPAYAEARGLEVPA